MSRTRKLQLQITVGILFAALAAAVPLFTSGYLLFQLDLVVLYMASGIGLNLALGYAGEFLLCQATVIGVASYTAGVFSYNYHWSVWETLPMAIIGAVVWQVIISIAGLRVRGLYLGLLTFFSVMVFPDLVLLLDKWTGGSLGLIGLPPLVGSAADTSLNGQYEITIGIAVVSTIFVGLIVWSGWGVRTRYLRDAPNALLATGVSVVTTKVAVYILSAIPAGMAGWAFVFINRSITSSVFDLSLTLVIFAGVEIVGPGTLWGPVVGVGLLEGYSQLVGPFSQWNVIGLGALLAVSLIVFPDGLRRGLQPLIARGLSTLMTSRADAAAELEVEHEQAVASNPPVFVKSPPAGDTGAPPTLVVEELRKSFGGVQAVRGVSFSAHSGRVLAIMGENGSGKTTLINLITGFLRPDTGTVVIQGKDATGRRPVQVARLGSCRTFQVPQLVGELTVLQNVEAGLLNQLCASPWHALLAPWSSHRIDKRRQSEALAVCQNIGFTAQEIDAPAEILPLGLRRLTEVARAAAAGAQVVFLDEPAAGLNEEELVQLSQSIRALARAGRTILVVEHNAQFVLNTCDDVLLIRAGEVESITRDVNPKALPEELRRHLRRAAVEVTL